MNLLLAMAAEHKARTGHDIWNERPFSPRHMRCDVCLYLGAEKRAMEEAEAEHWRQQAEAANAGATTEGRG